MARIMTPKGWRDVQFNNTVLNENVDTSYRKYDAKPHPDANKHTKAIANHTGEEHDDLIHVGSNHKEHEHVYLGMAHEDGSENHHHYVHNTKTGATHHVGVEHNGEVINNAKTFHKKLQGGHLISKSTANFLHKEHKDSGL